jgi:hypothetical protein
MLAFLLGLLFLVEDLHVVHLNVKMVWLFGLVELRSGMVLAQRTLSSEAHSS